MDFYPPRAVDQERGGYFQAYRDDGSVYAPAARHLVSSTRMIFNFAMEYLRTGDQACLAATRHGIDYLREVHLDPQTGGYLWSLKRARRGGPHQPVLRIGLRGYAGLRDGRRAGIEEARGWLDETHALMEQHFWSEHHGLYADEASADWQMLSDYRGQNANMHACEAMLAAFEATDDERYLEWAMTLARNIVAQASQAAKADGRSGRALRSRLERRLGLQPRLTPRTSIVLGGSPAGPPDRMGQAAADASSVTAMTTGCCRPRSVCSIRRWTLAWDGAKRGGALLRLRAGWHHLRRREVLLGAGREPGGRSAAERGHRRVALRRVV